MAKRNINYDHQGKHKNKARDSDKGKAIEEENKTPPSEGCRRSLQHGEGSSSTTSTNSDIQCNYLTYMNFEYNGNWRLLTIPLLSEANSNPVLYGVQIGMNDFLLISPAPAVSSRAHRQKEKRGSRHHDDTTSAESSTSRNSEASCSGTAGTMSNERDADNLSEAVIDRSKAEKKVRRNAKKKARRKEKRKEKLSRSTSAESGIPTKNEMFPILEGPEENHDEELNCGKDKGISDIPVSVILDSAPAGHETITEAGYEVNPSNLESKSVDHSQEICLTGKEECSSDESSLNGVVTKFQTQECANSDMQLVVTAGKRDKQPKRLPQNGQKRKGNNHSMWRKVQPDIVSRSEDKNESKDENSRRLNLDEEKSGVHSHTIPECSEQEPGSASIVENSLPVGNDPKLKVLSRVETLSLAHGDEPATKNSFAGEKSSPDSVNLSMLMKSEAHSFGADSSNISEAINETYRAKQLSEAVQLATGSPTAEFERLINAASPVICLWNEVRICSSCSHEVNRPLCRNQIPNICLGQLWKWYEEHGSYGLEVASEDFSYSKRTGFHHLAFRAYFVPSLSAIQLFEKSKSLAVDKDDRVPNSGTSRPFETGKASKKSSNFVHLPIPAMCILLRSYTLHEYHLPVHAKAAEDPELIFEYLESDLPQLRRPLHDKIKELISEGGSQNKMYGDPRKLDFMKLNKLHPQSWYSVAWYPIYRIPHGEHRACFLTFHSFSHLVRRSSTFGSKRMDNCVVSPVVGLQTYNAQRWFHLKQFGLSQAEGTPKLNTSEILRKRVQTLERGAFVFSRGEVSKGNLKSVSRHPDYEFFLSRRW